jgi:hypothetical protein
MTEQAPSPQKFYCPHCHVAAGKNCRSPKGPYHQYYYHDARKNYRDGWVAGFQVGVNEAAATAYEVVVPVTGEVTDRPKRHLVRAS